MKVYVDILFIQHFIINYFLIEVTGILLHEASKYKKKIFASACISIYSIIVIINNLKFANSIIGKLLLSAFTVIIAYDIRGIADIIRKVLILHISTYLLGGIIFSIINDIENQEITIIISAIICMTLTILVREIMSRIINREKFYCNIMITLNGKSIMAKAFLDTGNNINDVITGDAVIIINENKIEELSTELRKVLCDMKFDIPFEYQTKVRMISYSSLGNSCDILYGVRADTVIVYYDGKEIKNKNVVIAVGKNKFSNFDALIGLDLIEGGYVIGNSFIVKNESEKALG